MGDQEKWLTVECMQLRVHIDFAVIPSLSLQGLGGIPPECGSRRLTSGIIPEGRLLDNLSNTEDGCASEVRQASAADSSSTWSRLAFEQYRELATSFRNTWDVYVKFFTVFITFNVIAIGAVLEKVDPSNRALMAAAFIAQNVLASGTALGVAAYSRLCRQQLERTAGVLTADAHDPAVRAIINEAPIPGTTGVWAGLANFIAHLTLIAIWVLIATM